VHRTPPCQGSCPAGEDIRGWLNIVREVEKAPDDMSWQEYAFRRSTDANPFPAIMGRVCPAPCEDGCNRNEVDDHVGINSVEQFIGDHARENNFAFKASTEDTGKKVAIIGGGPAGLACAYQLRRKGHSCTVFEAHEKLGGMMRYGIPGYRIPEEVLDAEIKRIVDMGVVIRTGTKVGKDISVEQLDSDFDAVLVAMGAQNGKPLPIPGADAPNCITGIAFLNAFNDGRLEALEDTKIVVIGGGDTAIDVVSVARRIGAIKKAPSKDRPHNVAISQAVKDVTRIARNEGADVTLAYRRPIEKMPAARHEVKQALAEGVTIMTSLKPVEVVVGGDGKATALRLIEVDWVDSEMIIKEGTEKDIEAGLIVSAVGQAGDFEGMDDLDNGRGLVDSDVFQQIPGKPGWFVAGDIVRPHLLTTAIGQASIAAESIDHYMKHEDLSRRPKIDVHHFNLLNKLREIHHEPDLFMHEPVRQTAESNFAIHNFDDRSDREIVSSDKLFLSHFESIARNQREKLVVDSHNVLGHFSERIEGLPEETVVTEAERCMGCGLCIECDNCIIYCPQDAVHKTKKDETTTGRYVFTDYTRCVGCHICAEVCPTGYIQMGL